MPPREADQSEVNRREQATVHFLLGEVIDRLTDRSAPPHPHPWSPDQNVRVGVLGVTIHTPPPDPDSAAAEQPDEATDTPATAAPVDNRGVIGLDFIVADCDTLEIEIEVEYALYHPLLPDFGHLRAAATTAVAAAAGKKRARPTVPVQPTWTRDDRRCSFGMAISCGSEASTTSDDLSGGNPLTADCQLAVQAHFGRPDALWKLQNRQTLNANDATGADADILRCLAERRDRDWKPAAPRPVITLSTAPTPNGETAVSVSISNDLVLTERPAAQDLAVYDTRLRVGVKHPARLVPKRLAFSDSDLRYSAAATVVGRGRGCVARAWGESGIVADTLPVHTQRVNRTRDHGVDLTFAGVASDHRKTLTGIATAMRAFLRSWTSGSGEHPDLARQLNDLRSQFEAEVERFELGCDLLAADPRLERAFILANRTFAAARGGNAGWRLFQLAFIVTELGALAGRENPHDGKLRRELDSVDVLWFPTGGGKTEAYLGLITVALFFDRLRSKLHGASAWMLFPLRMLSVQQLARISDVAYHAEQLRQLEGIDGSPFELGYLVGSGNTPNRLGWSDQNGWWPGLDEFARLSDAERDDRRLVGKCPACKGSNTVGLDVDTTDDRLLHRCRSCGHTLAIHSSDEEVTRYLPSIIVSTVDKVASFARNGQLTAFNHGPRQRCPQHGWYTHDKCRAKDCKVDPSTHTQPAGFLDPPPALLIQDELHLVREELGVFAGHYNTLLAELARGAGHEPSKVIAATATIEQYQDQLAQVYGRQPRMFPVGGPTLEQSFYAETTGNVQRVFLGTLPAGGGTVKVDLASRITEQLVQLVHELTDHPAGLVAALAADGHQMTDDEVRLLLFGYELALGFVNSKAHGATIQDELSRLSERLSDPVRIEYLMGDSTLGELAAAVAAIEGARPGDPRAARIRALVATSVISHGVDLDRLNLEVLAGMPPTYADYIQVTARAGRSHVGLVTSVFDRNNRRETSMFQSFETNHRALERMVAPVPVNRYAPRSVMRTLPGVVSTLLWDETRNPTWGTTDDIAMTRRFRPWWDTQAAHLAPHLADRIARAYRCPVPGVALPSEEQRLVDGAVDRWNQIERSRMQQWQSDYLTDLFTSPAMTSLRDVDPPAEFSGGNKAEQIIELVQG
jgi:hypothetical protein